MTISLKTAEKVVAILRRRVQDRNTRRTVLLELSRTEGNESFRKSMKLIYDVELGTPEQKEEQ